jgi:hypothetical protein
VEVKGSGWPLSNDNFYMLAVSSADTNQSTAYPQIQVFCKLLLLRQLIRLVPLSTVLDVSLHELSVLNSPHCLRCPAIERPPDKIIRAKATTIFDTAHPK